MNLQEVLHANDVNRNTYNTLERRTELPFMKRDLVQGAGYDRYLVSHAVALGCLLEFMKDGVDSKRAAAAVGAAVDQLYPYIRDTVDTIADGNAPGPSWLNIVRYENGNLGFSSGPVDAPDLLNGEVVSRQSVNVIAVLKRLHARVNETAEAIA